MSMWTHIVASIDVDTFKEINDPKSYVEELLKNAPKITGSEEDAEVFVNVLGGHNIFTSADCANCEYYGGRCEDDEGGFYCSAPEDKSFRCPTGEYQSRVVITVIGDLRDRLIGQTQKEWKAFKKYVRKAIGQSYGVRNCSCQIK